MSIDALREYRRALALFCMSSSPAAVTAGELVEHMGVTAQTEAHPKVCWQRLDATEVAGILRSLEKAGLVQRGAEPRHNGRHGRPEPTWDLTAADEPYLLPSPPMSIDTGRSASSTRAAATPYDSLNREQLYTLLKFQDEHAGAIARFFRDVGDINDRFRHALAEVGMDLPE